MCQVAAHSCQLYGVNGDSVAVLDCLLCCQARRFPEGSDAKLFYEVGLQSLLICFVVVVLISGGCQTSIFWFNCHVDCRN